MMRFYCFFWILIPFLCWGREWGGLTREQELERRLNSLKETERRAKKVRQEMGLSY